MTALAPRTRLPRFARLCVCVTAWVLCNASPLGLAGQARAAEPEAAPDPAGSADPAAPAAPVAAAACSQTPEAVGVALAAVFKQLRDIYRNALPGPDGVRLRDVAAERLARAQVDVEAFTSAALRMAWDEADAGQRERWQAALGALLYRRYLQALRDPTRFALDVTRVTLHDCTAASVDATVHDLGSQRRTAITLHMRRTGDHWRAWDVQVGEMGLVASWRGRFLPIFRSGGTQELDRELRKLAHRFRVEAADR